MHLRGHRPLPGRAGAAARRAVSGQREQSPGTEEITEHRWTLAT